MRRARVRLGREGGRPSECKWSSQQCNGTGLTRVNGSATGANASRSANECLGCNVSAAAWSGSVRCSVRSLNEESNTNDCHERGYSRCYQGTSSASASDPKMVVHEREKGCASTRMDGIDQHNDVAACARMAEAPFSGSAGIQVVRFRSVCIGIAPCTRLPSKWQPQPTTSARTVAFRRRRSPLIVPNGTGWDRLRAEAPFSGWARLQVVRFRSVCIGIAPCMRLPSKRQPQPTTSARKVTFRWQRSPLIPHQPCSCLRERADLAYFRAGRDALQVYTYIHGRSAHARRIYACSSGRAGRAFIDLRLHRIRFSPFLGFYVGPFPVLE